MATERSFYSVAHGCTVAWLEHTGGKWCVRVKLGEPLVYDRYTTAKHAYEREVMRLIDRGEG